MKDREKKRQYDREYYRKNRERCLAIDKVYYQKNREEKIAKYKQWRKEHLVEQRKKGLQYYYAHLDECRTSNKKWRENNREYDLQRAKEWHMKHPEETKAANRKITIKRRLLKASYIKWLGGKCSQCGYNRNYAALVLHHIKYPKEKDSARDWRVDKTQDEILSKFKLLCHNCHTELHRPDADLYNLLRELDISPKAASSRSMQTHRLHS